MERANGCRAGEHIHGVKLGDKMIAMHFPCHSAIQ